jgi:hypothetical protein
MAAAAARQYRFQVLPSVSDITSIMKTTTLFSPSGRRSTLSAPSSLRVEVCPPSLRHAPSSVWQRLMFWMMAPAPHDAAPPLTRLPAVRKDFLAALADIDTADAGKVRFRIQQTASLRELWHVRADLYRVVGLAHTQTEAERRLMRLNCHFPTRAPRSQFAVL